MFSNKFSNKMITIKKNPYIKNLNNKSKLEEYNIYHESIHLILSSGYKIFWKYNEFYISKFNFFLKIFYK